LRWVILIGPGMLVLAFRFAAAVGVLFGPRPKRSRRGSPSRSALRV
jgi:hypothetical protein